MQRAHILLVVIVSLSFIAGATHSDASAQSLSQTRSIDHAMLLMISSHSMIEEEDGPAQTNHHKFGRMLNTYHAASTRTLKFNEIAFLRDRVRDYCTMAKAQVTAHFAGEDECVRLGMLEKECGKRTEWLDEQAEALERARRRRARYRGISGIFNRAGDAIRRARPGQAIRWFGKEVIPEVAKAALTGGVELKGRALRHFGKKILQKKVQRALQYEIVRRHAAKQAAVAQEESIDTIVVRAAKGWALSGAELQVIKKRCEGDSKDAQTESTTSDTCAGDYGWIDEYWEIVRQALVEEGRNCQQKAAMQYRSCLESKVYEGMCKDLAIEACQVEYAGIPINLPGDLTLTNANIKSPYRNFKEETFTMSIPASGGSVTGRYTSTEDRNRVGMESCRLTVDHVFEGVFDPKTCKLSGTGTRTLELSAEGIHSPCHLWGCDWGSEGCTEETLWALVLKDDQLECDPNGEGWSICDLLISVPK